MGMRLGQGFNSYNQQICLDNAVLVDNNHNRDRVREYYIEDIPHKATKRTMLAPLADDNAYSTAASTGDDEQKPKLQPWIKPQIVTYSSRFVDKLQDVTDSMNVSGALSIQTATVGGKGSGNYVDSDKFKSSDINFHLQVKVTNQIYKPEEYTLFNAIHNLPQADFTSVYGDCFISGFEEGGEFNAIVSMKVTDKSKIYKIKAELEGSVKGGVQIDAKISGEINKESTDKSTETTIAVNWAGGGSIKAPEEPWTIETMTKAAAAFPDLVAMTPQRTYAILTKYTALESFQRQTRRYSILDYENASIYTNMLMDHFMDYKVMWKQISQATYELQRGTAKIDWAETSDEIADLATITPLPDDQIGNKLEQSTADDPPKAPPTQIQAPPAPEPAATEAQIGDDEDDYPNGDAEVVEAVEAAVQRGDPVGAMMAIDRYNRAQAEAEAAQLPPKKSQFHTNPHKISRSMALQKASGAVERMVDGKPKLQFRPFKPTLGGLITARKVCRSEMAKIVNEVDLITKAPELAIDTKRDNYFLEPLVYKQLLPIVRTWYDDMLPDAKMAEIPIILGYSAPVESTRGLPGIMTWLDGPQAPQKLLFTSVERIKRKSKNYRMIGLPGTAQKDMKGDLRFFNDLEGLDPTYRPTMIAIWATSTVENSIFKQGIVQGIQITYANGERKIHGNADDHKLCYWLALTSDDFGTETIFEIEFGLSTIRSRVKEGEALNDTETVVGHIRLVTSTYRVLDTRYDNPTTMPNAPPVPSEGDAKPTVQQAGDASTDDTKSEIDMTTLANANIVRRIGRPDVGGWSSRGFFGFVKGAKGFTRFLSMGVVFGRDKFVPRPPTPEYLPLCKFYLGLQPEQQTIIQEVFKKKKTWMPGRFIMGEILHAQLPEKPPTFNHLQALELGWTLDYVIFRTKNDRLTSMTTAWLGQQPETNGTFDANETAVKTWKLEVAPKLLLNSKITSISSGQGNTAINKIQSVEFVKSEDGDGNLPPWLLDITTMRYFVDGSNPSKYFQAVEAAPSHDAAVWSVRGFAGATANGDIVSLGVIWGRDK